MGNDGLLSFVEKYLRDVVSAVDDAVNTGGGADVMGAGAGTTGRRRCRD